MVTSQIVVDQITKIATSKTIDKVAKVATDRGGKVSGKALKFMREKVGIKKMAKGVDWVKRKADSLLLAVTGGVSNSTDLVQIGAEKDFDSFGFPAFGTGEMPNLFMKSANGSFVKIDG